MHDAASRIYVVGNPRIDAVKVGITTRNPKVRLSNYNTCCPDRAYYYAALVEVADAHLAEKKLHETLDAFRVGNTEWFRGIPLEAVLRLVQSLAKPEGTPNGYG